MEQAHIRTEKHTLQGPHRVLGLEMPEGFAPLRLLLEAVGLRIEVHRADAIVGRHSEAEVRLALPDISRRHCRLVFEDGQWRVHDLNSLNGVFVNGERLQEARLYPGDHLQLGTFSFLVEEAAPLGLSRHDILRIDVLQSIAEKMRDQKWAS